MTAARFDPSIFHRKDAQGAAAIQAAEQGAESHPNQTRPGNGRGHIHEEPALIDAGAGADLKALNPILVVADEYEGRLMTHTRPIRRHPDLQKRRAAESQQRSVSEGQSFRASVAPLALADGDDIWIDSQT